MTLAEQISEAARNLGFTRIAFAPVERFDEAATRFADWMSRGYGGQMAYLAGNDRADPRLLLPEAKTLIVVALAYGRADTVELRLRRDAPLTGTIARYARGADYHDVMRNKLRKLADACSTIAGRPVAARVCVDTAPLLERSAAERAGLGFTAKSTMTIIPGVGSYVLLGELLLDLEIAPGTPQARRCGTCRLCLDACPTGAFVDAHVLDARRCISYLTIELTGPIPRELRSAIGTRVFGCDVCQEVCPFNAGSAQPPSAPEFAPRPELEVVDLVALLELTSSGYRKLVRKTALRRAHRATLSRNAAIALGNSGDVRAVEPLSRALDGHPLALVRGHAAWALGELRRVAGDAGREALERAVRKDADSWVREEARLALDRFTAAE